MKSCLTLLSFLAISILILGCAAKELNPAAASIIVTKQAAPTGCQFKGSVIGEQGGSLTGHWTSNKKLALGALNDLKNNAHALGANYVVLEDTGKGNTMSGNRYGMSGGQTDVTHMGNAYDCPPESIGVVGR